MSLYNPLMQELLRLILIGFMGAGKSTVGPILAAELGWKFIDLDQQIEKTYRRTVAEIFSELGEAEFRRRERQAFSSLHQQEKMVLALGGGAIEDELTRSLLSESRGSCVVFLHAELPELLARCTGEGKTRPLLALPEALEERHRRRLPYYRAADITVSSMGLTPREVATRVLIEVRKRTGTA